MDSNEIYAIKERVIKQLNDFYNGSGWVTDNFSNRVFPLTQQQAFKKFAGHSHSISEQVAHITAWRNFVVQKLNGVDNFDIEDNSLQDWPEPNDWNMVKEEFEARHNNLVASIKNFPYDKWNSTVPGRNYSFTFLINGIVEHDYYHYGQIGVLLPLIKKAE